MNLGKRAARAAGAAILLFALAADAQTVATLRVEVVDPDGGAVSGAGVTLRNRLTGFERRALADDAGLAFFTNVPFHQYELEVEAPGFAPGRRTVSLRSNVPVELAIALRLAAQSERITVSAHEVAALVDVEATGTRTTLQTSRFERMPIAVGSRGLEAMLASFPGFAPNANGAIHPRGAHNQMTYLVDGMPISDQLTGSFASSLDPNIVQTIELFTGNVPAEFGSKVSGVAHLSTRSGLGTGRAFTGSTEVSAASFDTLASSTQMGGERGRLGYFASVFLVKSHRFLDQVSLDNLHNGGNAERAYARLDYQASSKDFVRLHLMGGRSSFELANLRSQHASGQDQRQLLRDSAVWLGYVRSLTPEATYDLTASYRASIAQLFPSAGDTPVTASQARHLSTVTFANRLNVARGAHVLRGGADAQFFPLSESFTFGITDPDFNAPDSPGFRESLEPYDLSRGGRLFLFSKERTGRLLSTFVQDNVRRGRFSFALGLRYDAYRLIVKGYQLQPRVGLAFHLRETGTVFRASYNRNYQTPPNENLLLASSPEASVLVPASVREALGNTFIPIRPERQNVYEAGVQQSLGGRLGLDASFYHKNSTDQQDNDNFLDTGIIFPTTLKKIRVNGAEVRLTAPEIRGLSGWVSLTHFRAISTPPFTGGLFLGQTAVDLLSSGPFVIDHDQKLGVHALAQYRTRRNFWSSLTVRHDSGLVSNPSDPAEVAQDPDFFDLLPYVNLESDPPRVRPRTIFDCAVGYESSHEGRRRWDLQFQVLNLTNKTALYNFQSVFVGTRLVAPRALGLKWRWYW
jgi:outer membrane cobalamin receptor